MKRLAARLVVFSLTSLLFMELVFRFVLPACELPSSVQGEDGFQLYDPGYSRSGHYSEGSIPYPRSRWFINDAGWNSLFPYRSRAERDRPLIAILGDSGIESFYTSVEDHIDTWLFRILYGNFSVYAFGRHSQPLVEMTLLMERIDSLYEPDAFVMFISHDALRQSLLRGPLDEYHYLLPAPSLGTFVSVSPSERRPSVFARGVLRSALARYLLLNRDLLRSGIPLQLVRVTPTYQDRIAPLGDTCIHDLMPMAGWYLLSRISGMLEDRRLLIVVDESFLRGTLRIRGSTISTDESLSAEFMLLERLSSGFDRIDFMNVSHEMQRDYDNTGVSHTDTYNRHLNGHGNNVVAHAIAQYLRDTGTLQRMLIEWGDRNGSTDRD